MHKEITARKMKSEGWMSIWALKEQTPMDMEKENINMVETIKNLQKDVQSHKADNERLMTAKEQQDDFNMNLMQSLNRIEKKLDNGEWLKQIRKL
jgi:predicted RNase H-like nuclease (RuvC/YqgF family)